MTEDDKEIKRSKKLLHFVFDDNYWWYLLCYLMIDGNNILPTAFEFMVFVANTIIHSHILATKKLLSHYITEEIEPLVGKVQLEQT